MSSPQPTLKQRPGSRKAGADGAAADKGEEILAQIQQQAKETVKNDWEYKLGLVVITVLSFVTRFWGITHPNQVVFDEVHFGKVCSNLGDTHNSITFSQY